MKIALDGSLLGARFSGVERAVAQLLAHLPAALDETDQALVFVGRRFDRFCEQFFPAGLDPRLQIHQTGLDNGCRPGRIAWQHFVLPRLCHEQQADLFHAPAYVTSALTALPTVLTLYDLDALEHPELCGRGNRWHYRWAIPLGARRAWRVLVPSAQTRREIAARLPGVLDRTRIVPLGVGAGFAMPGPEDDALRARYRLPSEYLFWVGNLEPKKQVGVLLEALVRLRDRQETVPPLVLAGDLSRGTEAVMQQMLAAGLQGQVIFLGRVPDADLPAIYRGASLFCFPSVTEGFGLPPLEAMAAGVPVIVAEAGALPEVCGDAASVVPTAEPDAWATEILRLLRDVTLRRHRIAIGRSRAAQYNWAYTARQTVAIYRDVLAEQQAGAPRPGDERPGEPGN